MKQILCVEDSTSVRKLVAFALKSKGYSVLSAENGLEGLEKLAQANVNAIVLDINMPKMDGFEFLTKIRADETCQQIPVIMLTTEGQDEDRAKALELGATNYLVKPFKPTELITLIDKVLED